MALRRSVVLVFLAACGPMMTPSVVAEVSAGIAHPTSHALSDDGVVLRMATAVGAPGDDFGAGMHLTFRQTGETQELALGYHRFWVTGLGSHAAMFVRLGVNLLEWDRVHADDRLGIGGPSFELGLGAREHGGPCIVMSAARDVRFHERDDTFLEVSLGICTIAPTRALFNSR